MNKIKKVFIIGAFRTGSTYIARMLGNHDKICALKAAVNFLRFAFIIPLIKLNNFST